MENIIDIYNIDKATIFPLALGYKIIIILAFLIILSLILHKYYSKFFAFFNKKTAWKKEFKVKLDHLITDNNELDSYKLYVLIKQIAIKIYGRKKVAPLSGVEFLLFLQKNDPNNFAWSTHALCLINHFTPEKNNLVTIDNFTNLIKAIKKWL